VVDIGGILEGDIPSSGYHFQPPQEINCPSKIILFLTKQQNVLNKDKRVLLWGYVLSVQREKTLYVILSSRMVICTLKGKESSSIV
jgi:hypothetical protein